MKNLIAILLVFACTLTHAQDRPAAAKAAQPAPDTTLCFARRDTCDLKLDFYTAAPDRGPCADTLRKPVVIHVFGGAFLTGRRNQSGDIPWYRELADQGYHVAAIDYRLGLKGLDLKPDLSAVGALMNAIQMAVDDLFAATNYLIDNAEALGIDPDRIVVSGSSAGAITALEAEWEICNRKEPAAVLPGWFNYAGILSFSGAILSLDGPITFPQKPCPILLHHGTADKIVPYGRIDIFRKHFAGSDAIAKKLGAAGANYQILRYSGNGHEIANLMRRNLPEELRFLEENVIKGVHRTMDATLSDGAIEKPDWGNLQFQDIYDGSIELQ